MIIVFNFFSHFLDREVIRSGIRKSYEGLPDMDFLFHEDNLEVKKLLPSISPPLWVIPYTLSCVLLSRSFKKGYFSVRLSFVSNLLTGYHRGTESPLQVSPS